MKTLSSFPKLLSQSTLFVSILGFTAFSCVHEAYADDTTKTPSTIEACKLSGHTKEQPSVSKQTPESAPFELVFLEGSSKEGTIPGQYKSILKEFRSATLTNCKVYLSSQPQKIEIPNSKSVLELESIPTGVRFSVVPQTGKKTVVNFNFTKQSETSTPFKIGNVFIILKKLS